VVNSKVNVLMLSISSLRRTFTIYAAAVAGENLETVVRGRDLSTGLPKSLKISSDEIREALTPVLNQIITALQEVLEETPPELLSDILEKGITLAGGGALLRGLDKKIAEETKLPVWVVDDPLTTVVRGCGKVLENLDLLAKVKVTGGLR